MFSTTDTIVAIATPPGRGGIGVVRVSGSDAHSIALSLLQRTRALEPRRATLGAVRMGAVADEVVATYFPAPASYTGDDVVEISAHGSPVVLRGIVECAVSCGARLAEPGEFTLRAYLNGRIDLMQAEAVGDLIDAVTPLQARAAFDQLQGTLTRAIADIDRMLFDLIARLEASVDFPEEGYHFADAGDVATEIDAILARSESLVATARRGRLVREGVSVAIVGAPNVGKSSLFNALVGAERAIVSEIPGTTRDLVTETVDMDGLRITLVDTAGVRDTRDAVELLGVARTKGAAGIADLVLLVVDACDLDAAPIELVDGTPSLLIVNKSDIGVRWVSDPSHCVDTKDIVFGNRHSLTNSVFVLGEREKSESGGVRHPSAPVRVSAVTRHGLSELRQRIVEALDFEPTRDTPEMTNVRHIRLVERANAALGRARRAALSEGEPLPEEFVLADLQEARAAFEEVTGKRTPEDVLAHIFSRFCIGK
jgi:tRNA modification GTPase